MKTEGSRSNAKMRKQLGCSTGVFGRDQSYGAQHAQGTERDVLKVSDRRCDDGERAGHRQVDIVLLLDVRAPKSGYRARTERGMHPSEPLPHFVDDYLAYLQEVQPSHASFDGSHLHDDLLDDLSRAAIDAHVRALGGFSRRLHQIDGQHLAATERIERDILAANVESRMFDLEQVRTFERSPQLYADIIGTSLASQALFPYAPEADRARRVVSRLRQIPRLVQAARDNIKECPGIYVKVGLESWRGALRFLEADLPRAFASLDDLHILGDLADTSTEAAVSIAAFTSYLETDLAARAKASFRLGRDRFEQKLKLDEGIAVSADRLLTIALRELQSVQDEFRTVAGRLGHGEAQEIWKQAKAQHHAVGELIPTAQAQLVTLQAFLERQGIVTVPAGEPVVVGPTPEFYRWASASLWAAGPFESKPGRAYYYLTDVDRSWSPERQQEHLRDFNIPALWNISIHEVYPGHYLHYQHLRRVDSKVRKSLFFAPASFVEGWAHYAEQMMLDAGFERGNAAVKLGQLAEALVRLARVVVGIRLHCEDLSVEQGMRFFRDEAFLEEATARREAERGTFDPTYLVYSIGKLMLLKLRNDYQEREGGKFSLRTFHDTLLGQGSAPFWAHRRLMLGEDAGTVLE